MKNTENWIPTKYVLRRGRLKASRDRRSVNIGSRLITDLTAFHFEKTLKVHASGFLLDLGCGEVPLWEAYRPHISNNICADRKLNIHVDLILDLGTGLPFREEVFDTIILSDVLEHVPDPEKIWMEMSRVLKPGGKLICNTPFLYWLHEAPHDYFRYTEFSLRHFAENSGFRIISLMAIGGVPEVLSDILAKSLRRFPLVGKALSSGIQAVARNLLRFKAVEDYSARTARNFPLGYFLVAQKA